MLAILNQATWALADKAFPSKFSTEGFHIFMLICFIFTSEQRGFNFFLYVAHRFLPKFVYSIWYLRFMRKYKISLERNIKHTLPEYISIPMKFSDAKSMSESERFQPFSVANKFISVRCSTRVDWLSFHYLHIGHP